MDDGTDEQCYEEIPAELKRSKRENQTFIKWSQERRTIVTVAEHPIQLGEMIQPHLFSLSLASHDSIFYIS